ncbi:hypothetical protein IGI04_026752 [Brassica rapa subsp. trilocularis]|uniref:Uncharacterized protein n=1 Tax=Brassica rapa subsp. trilocularis TaxID=1813537 RepID=A0ABQ7KZN7_BRACM|nr:hypothetical protein IGI04_026752 [Brassica rapa subsp. trilocularis]
MPHGIKMYADYELHHSPRSLYHLVTFLNNEEDEEWPALMLNQSFSKSADSLAKEVRSCNIVFSHVSNELVSKADSLELI